MRLPSHNLARRILITGTAAFTPPARIHGS